MKIILLDRDGVINRYPGDTKYVTSWKEFKFLSGAKYAIAKLLYAKPSVGFKSIAFLRAAIAFLLFPITQ